MIITVEKNEYPPDVIQDDEERRGLERRYSERRQLERRTGDRRRGDRRQQERRASNRRTRQAPLNLQGLDQLLSDEEIESVRRLFARLIDNPDPKSK
jgi:hypothetical protein